MKKIFNIFIACFLILAFGLASTACVDEVQDPAQKYAAPTITGFSPAEGLPSSVVTITGTEFGAERTERIGRVYFGGVEATEYVSWSDTEIQVRVPENGKSGNITLWVWKNNVTTEAEFTCIPGAKVNSINPSEAYPSSEITLVGENFGYFLDLPLSDILVEFKTIEGTEKVAATSLTETEVKVTVPATAQSGPLTVYFGDMQTITTPELTLVGDMSFDHTTYLEIGGTISIEDESIGSTKNGGWVIYEFKAPATGYFETKILTGTTKDGSYLNIDINSDLNTLKNQEINEDFTHPMPNTGSWTPTEELTYGVWYMEVGKTYYMKLTFLQDGSTWVGNANGIRITLSADQEAASGVITFDLATYVEAGGTIDIGESGIGSNKNGAWVIYEFSTPKTGLYEVHTMTATTKDGSKFNIDINSDFTTLKTQAINDDLTQDMPNTGSWSSDSDVPKTFGPFSLQAHKTYYLKVSFITSSTSWVGNLHSMQLKLADDQNSGPVTDSDGVSKDYVIYENDFNKGDSYSPFRDGWAWDPSYIKVVNQYCEFYFNQAAYDEDPRRMRAGCELTCDYKTTTAGWYGFKIFLPEGKFPKDIKGSIIAQIFNQGTSNSWAGHLSIDNDQLKLSYRNALIDPTVGIVGTLEWDKWIPVVVYFKVGKNGKGNLKVWMGDDMKESEPDFDSGPCPFGFGDWIDDDTLNGESKGGEDVGDAIGAKFGLYVSSGGDRTIRFDDVKLLEGNPSGAFEIVRPK